MKENVESRDQRSETAPSGASDVRLSGTVNQIDLAERIRVKVSEEFDDVATSFRQAASKQEPEARSDTEAILVILEDKRAQVLSRTQAGYFIQSWREISDQVRQMILRDPRYPVIRARRAARRSKQQRTSPL